MSRSTPESNVCKSHSYGMEVEAGGPFPQKYFCQEFNGHRNVMHVNPPITPYAVIPTVFC